MPAYSFLAQWVPKLRDGSKTTTIRALRKDGRAPRVGEPFIAFTGMRTKRCQRLFDSTVRGVARISIGLRGGRYRVILRREGERVWTLLSDPAANVIAGRDGFASLAQFWRFFLPRAHARRKPVRTFRGHLITFDPPRKHPAP